MPIHFRQQRFEGLNIMGSESFGGMTKDPPSRAFPQKEKTGFGGESIGIHWRHSGGTKVPSQGLKPGFRSLPTARLKSLRKNAWTTVEEGGFSRPVSTNILPASA